MHVDAPATVSQPGRRYLIAALALALAAALGLALIPVYDTGKTFVSANGPSFICLTLAPALLVSAVLVMPGAGRRSTTILAVVLLTGFGLVTSVGLFFLPSALCLIAAANAQRPKRLTSLSEQNQPLTAGFEQRDER